LALSSPGFFSQITAQSYYSVLAIGCDFVRNGQGRKIVRILALIEHRDLVQAAHAELFPVRLGDVMRRLFGSVQPNIAIIWLSVQSA
jgi:hypothetical protein